MPKKIIYEKEFFTRSVMCLEDCGVSIDNALHRDLKRFISSNLLPEDVEILTDIVPYTVAYDDENDDDTQNVSHFSGLNKLLITIIGEKPFPLEKEQDFYHALKEVVEGVGHDFLSEDDLQQEFAKYNHGQKRHRPSYRAHWKNIVINLLVLAILISLSAALPPSLPLTVSLITISFLTTAYTSRHYLSNFWQSIRTRQWFNMSTGVSGGWTLSLVHALYHLISMPHMASFSMTFMNVGMPVMLITLVNVMDEIQHYVARESRKMRLKGLDSLYDFSQLYECCDELQHDLQSIPGNAWILRRKSHIKVGMLVKIKPGGCVPVNGKIMQGASLVDTSIRDGETQHFLRVGEEIPGGAINLVGQELVIRAESTAYRSAMNSVILRANRAENQEKIKTTPSTIAENQAKIKTTASTINSKFTYLYGTLILSGLFISILVPALLSSLSLPLTLQMITGILFAVCPCTILIAHRLPRLWLQYHLSSKKGIGLRDESFLERCDPIHTVVFDKTGTLTAGTSEMLPPTDDFSIGLLQRIYLAESRCGTGHPLAQAICQYIKPRLGDYHLIADVDVTPDPRHRGLAGRIQGVDIQIGSYGYLAESNVKNLPLKDAFPKQVQEGINAGYTPIFVAERGIYQGTIFVKHAVDPDILASLKKLKKHGENSIKLILITGDTPIAAQCFVQECDGIFDVVHAGKEPSDKEAILSELMAIGYDFVPMSDLSSHDKNQPKYGKVYLSQSGNYLVCDKHGHVHRGQLSKDIKLSHLDELFQSIKFDGSLKMKKSIIESIGILPLDPAGIWFVGDGLNDAPCARVVSEMRGVSCAMHAKDKAAFFTDISLNGSLNYLFQWQRLNRFWKHHIRQNQGLLIYGALVLPVLLICLTLAGAGMVPIIPLLIMLSTTFVILFNTYRMQVSIDVALDESSSWMKRCFASNASLALLVGGSALLIASLVVMTFASGHLMLPTLVFSTGIIVAVSNGLLLTSIACFGAFGCLALAHGMSDRFSLTKTPKPIPVQTQTAALTKSLPENNCADESSNVRFSLGYLGKTTKANKYEHSEIPAVPKLG